MADRRIEPLMASGGMVRPKDPDITLRFGEARVAVLVDESCFVLASDKNPMEIAITPRKKALMLALLETAIEEVRAMKVGE